MLTIFAIRSATGQSGESYLKECCKSLAKRDQLQGQIASLSVSAVSRQRDERLADKTSLALFLLRNAFRRTNHEEIGRRAFIKPLLRMAVETGFDIDCNGAVVGTIRAGKRK